MNESKYKKYIEQSFAKKMEIQNNDIPCMKKYTDCEPLSKF